MVVYLIRHTSVDGPQGVCYGQTDVPLNPTFEEEAALTSARLKGLQFDKVYMSPLTRCVRLATFCGYTDGERDDRIKEINFGAWEMHRFDELTDAIQITDKTPLANADNQTHEKPNQKQKKKQKKKIQKHY